MARSSPFAALPRFRRGAFALFLLVAVVSALLADHAAAADLVLTPARLFKGQTLWAPLTANFIFADSAVALVIGTAAVQWFIGGQLEDFWGTRKYLTFVIGCGVFGYAAQLGFGALIGEVATTPVSGATAMDLATVTAFGVVFGKRPLSVAGVIPLTSRGLAIFIGALAILSPLVRGAPWPTVIPWVMAMLAALAVTTQPWRRLRSSGKLGGRKKKGRAHLSVVRPDRELLN